MKVLIISCERKARTIEENLRRQRFVVDRIQHVSGIQYALLGLYRAVIVDVDGFGDTAFGHIRYIRERKPHVPIIAYSANKSVRYKVSLLRLCDDYIEKPVAKSELVARLRAVLRRGEYLYSDVLEVGDLRIDLQSVQVTRAGKEIRLRNREFALLAYFARHAGVVLSAERILNHVWEQGVGEATNTVAVHVRHLRRKIDDIFEKKLIHTIPKKGYRFQA